MKLRRLRLWGLALVALLVGLVGLGPLAASAGDDPRVTLTPTRGPVGTSVTASVSGFEREDTVTLLFNGARVASSPGQKGREGKGTRTLTFVVPAATPGPALVQVVEGNGSGRLMDDRGERDDDRDDDDRGGHRGATATFTVTLPVTATSVPATATSVPATATSVPATATSVPATATSVPATATTVPVTATTVPATATSVPATATTVPVTATTVPATPTAVPPTATATNTPVPTATPTGTSGTGTLVVQLRGWSTGDGATYVPSGGFPGDTMWSGVPIEVWLLSTGTPDCPTGAGCWFRSTAPPIASAITARLNATDWPQVTLTGLPIGVPLFVRAQMEPNNNSCSNPLFPEAIGGPFTDGYLGVTYPSLPAGVTGGLGSTVTLNAGTLYASLDEITCVNVPV